MLIKLLCLEYYGIQKAVSILCLDYYRNFLIHFLTFFHSLDDTSVSMELLTLAPYSTELLTRVLESTRDRLTLLSKL